MGSMVVAKALLAVACRRLALAPGRQVPDALSLTLRGPSESKLSIGHSGDSPARDGHWSSPEGIFRTTMTEIKALQSRSTPTS